MSRPVVLNAIGRLLVNNPYEQHRDGLDTLPDGLVYAGQVSSRLPVVELRELLGALRARAIPFAAPSPDVRQRVCAHSPVGRLRDTILRHRPGFHGLGDSHRKSMARRTP